METQVVGEVGTTVARVEEPKEPRFFSVGLHGGDGSRMVILATRRKDGCATTAVTVTSKGPDGKNRNVKGATERHPSFDAARATVEKLAGEAGKLGWHRKSGAGGFKARPDAFDARSLPRPGAAPKAPAQQKKK